MLFRLEQLEKAKLSMFSTLSPIITDERPEQLENALYPILVTLLGIVSEVIFGISSHIRYGIDLTSFPKTNDEIAFFASPKGAVSHCLAFQNTDFIFLQLENASYPIDVTVVGIVIDSTF